MSVDVSVVIPLFNRSEIVEYTLKSLDPLRHPDVSIEVIIVDDASSDGSPDVVAQKFPWATLIRNAANKGAPACRNQGLKLAKGEFVLFLDSDDLVEEHFFCSKVDYLRGNAGVVGVYGPWEYFDSAHAFSWNFVRPRHSVYPLYNKAANDLILFNLLSGWYIPINAVLWRKTALLEAGGFTTDLSINQDVDLLFRMLLQFRIVGQRGPKALIRIHDGERLGDASSEVKYAQILALRKKFVRLLEVNNLWNDEMKSALAKFCLTTWASIRLRYPRIGNEFLILYRRIGVRITLDGRWVFRAIVFFLGAVNTIKVKQFINRKTSGQSSL